jgi:hypothetical protein
MKTIATVLACLFLAGCSWFAHKAKVITAPDFTAIHQAADRAEKSTDSAAKAAAKAGEHLIKAKARHGEAIVSHAEEEKRIDEADVKIKDLQMRVTVELRPEVDKLAGDLAAWRAQHSTTNAALLDIGTEIGEATVLDAEAVKAANLASAEQVSIRTILSPKVEAEAAENARKYNETEKAREADSKKLMWYRSHWWGSWIVLIMGVVGSVAFYVLKIAAKP